jgi:hypothetical protein
MRSLDGPRLTSNRFFRHAGSSVVRIMNLAGKGQSSADIFDARATLKLSLKRMT